MPHKEDHHHQRSRHHHFLKTLHQIWIVQQNHLWPRTPVRSKIPEGTRKNTWIQTRLIIHLPPRLMEKLKGLTKKSKLTSRYSADQILPNGLNKYPWQNLSITSDPTLPLANLRFISSWDMNRKHSLTSLTKPTSLPWKSDSMNLSKQETRPLPPMSLLDKPWKVESNPNSHLLLLETKYGLKPEISKETSLIQNSLQKEKDPSKSLRSSLHCHTNWKFQSHGKYTQCFMPRFSPPIKKMTSTTPTTWNHHLTWLMEKKNMKLSGY